MVFSIRHIAVGLLTKACLNVGGKHTIAGGSAGGWSPRKILKIACLRLNLRVIFQQFKLLAS